MALTVGTKVEVKTSMYSLDREKHVRVARLFAGQTGGVAEIINPQTIRVEFVNQGVFLGEGIYSPAMLRKIR